MSVTTCTVGYIILAHEAPDAVAALAAHLSGQGAPVVIHADKRAKVFRGELEEALQDCELEREARGEPVLDGASIDLMATRTAEWGTFGLVDATLDAARLLLERAPGLSHVVLLSGSCLPLRSHGELAAFLAGRPGVNFIESVPAESGGWVKGGLSLERFTLWFPVAWKRRRWLFDRLVELQRGLGVRRKMPAGLTPHLGNQWWCLSARTLRGILADDRLGAYVRFFRRSWIPDESFFQTLVRRDGAGSTVAPPLLLTRFDAAGRPVVFYDDHEALLARSDYFFARKISPWAVGLRRRFLRHGPRAASTGFERRMNEAIFAAADQRRAGEHRGLQTQARLPVGTNSEVVETARPYGVLVSDDRALLAQAASWIEAAAAGVVMHRQLFARTDAGFAGGEAHYIGNLSGDARLRDYRPEQFLARLIWADRDRPMLFCLLPEENDRINRMILRDGNARVILIAETYEERNLIAEMAKRPPERNGWVPPPEIVYSRIARIGPEELRQLMSNTDGSALTDALGFGGARSDDGLRPGASLRQVSM